MSRPKHFKPGKTIQENTAVAIFGALASDPLARQIFSCVSLWPTFENEKAQKEFGEYSVATKFTKSHWIGNYAKVLRWTAKRADGRRHHFTETRIHPAIEAVLDILVPALCRRDSTPFKFFVEAIEAMKDCNFPDLPVALHALNLACELTGRAPHFNDTGEPLEADELAKELNSAIASPVELIVPSGESKFRREVEKRSKQQIEAGNFNRLCRDLKITFAKDPRKGGRKRKSQLPVL
jgi:hypothetical protein